MQVLFVKRLKGWEHYWQMLNETQKEQFAGQGDWEAVGARRERASVRIRRSILFYYKG